DPTGSLVGFESVLSPDHLLIPAKNFTAII
ncbi:unnamed protein product, partial [marine sediment metagenome]